MPEPDPELEPSEQEAPAPSGPRASVILVAFNQADPLRRALTAVEASTGRDRFEVIVVDCGSTDDSRTIDTEFPAIKLLRLPHHLGLTKAMNIASRTAQSELLFYISPDVELEPGAIDVLASRMEAETDPKGESDLVAVCPLLTDEEGELISQIRPLPDAAILHAILNGDEYPAQPADPNQPIISVPYASAEALMLRKVFLRSMSNLDERFGHYWADADFAIKAYRAEKRIELVTGARAHIYPESDPVADDPLGEADRINGAIELLGKYFGGTFGPRFLGGLKALLTFNFSRASVLLGGSKLDGSQA